MSPDRLKSLRERADLSAKQAAALCGMSLRGYRRFESWASVESKAARLERLGKPRQQALTESMIPPEPAGKIAEMLL